jgi:hypothetical protein
MTAHVGVITCSGETQIWFLGWTLAELSIVSLMGEHVRVISNL